MVLQLLASLALRRTLYVILGWRPVLLLPLTFALFTPLSVPAFAWWAAALNSLPMLAALVATAQDEKKEGVRYGFDYNPTLYPQKTPAEMDRGDVYKIAVAPRLGRNIRVLL